MFVIFLFLLCCSAFFSGSETALFSLSAVQLKRLGESKGGAGQKLSRLLSQPRKMMVTILLGNELINVSMSIVGAAMISRVFAGSVEAQTIAAVMLVTPVVLVCGEILPKNIAFKYAPQLAPVIVWPLGLFYRLVRPLRSILTKMADQVIKLFGGRPDHTEPMIMEEEYRRLVDLGRKKGVIASEEHELIHNVLDFTDKVVADIMTPANKVFAMPIEMPYDDVIVELRSVQFSRVPFYSGKRDSVVGILHARDLFAFHRKKMSGETLSLAGLLHEPIFIEGSTSLETLLREFQRMHLHMAIVRGHDGRMMGLVTMDDVLEELFGEIE